MARLLVRIKSQNRSLQTAKTPVPNSAPSPNTRYIVIKPTINACKYAYISSIAASSTTYKKALKSTPIYNPTIHHLPITQSTEPSHSSPLHPLKSQYKSPYVPIPSFPSITNPLHPKPKPIPISITKRNEVKKYLLHIAYGILQIAIFRGWHSELPFCPEPSLNGYFRRCWRVRYMM